MRIDELVLERYGHFVDRRLNFRPDARLHVVLGANEAGKTTALAAISDLLFGFPHQTSYDFRHGARSLRIGARLTLRNGETLAFRRRKGRERTLVDANDAALPDDLLAPVLGAVTREMFQAEFGLTAQALRDGGKELARAGGRLSEALAAASAGMGALSHLGARFAGEASELFAPGRRVASKPFYAALDAYQEADAALKQALVTDDIWTGALTAVAEAETRAAAARAELERLGADITRLDRIGRVSGKLAALDAARVELAAMTAPALDAAAIAAAREALRQNGEIAARLGKLDAEADEDAQKRARLRLDPDLLARRETIDRLRQRVGEIRKDKADLPRREGEQRELAAGLESAAQALGLADSAALSARQPSAPALAQVRAMIGDGRAAQQHVDAARDALESARADFDKRASEAGAPAHAADPEPLQQRLALFEHLPGDGDQARREAAACEAEQRALDEAFAALTPRIATLEALAVAPLPDRTRVEAAGRAFEKLADGDRDHAAALAAAGELVRGIDAEMSRLAAGGASATRDDLARLRGQRDAALAALRGADDPAHRDAALAHLGGVVHHIDLVTDVLLSAGERLTLLQNATERRAEAEQRATALIEAGRARGEERAALTARWRTLWAPAGVTPDEPAAMAAWLDRVARLRQRREELARRRAELAALNARIEAALPQFAMLRDDLGLAARDLAPDLAFREARAALARIQKLWTERREGEARRAAARDAVEKAEAHFARAGDALRQWREAWPDALADIALGPGASPAAAETALDLWQSAGVRERDHRRLSQRIDSLLRDIAAFEADVAALCLGGQAALAARPALDAIEAMVGELAAADAAAHQARALDDAARTRAGARAALERDRETARSAIAATRGLLGLDDADALETALDAAARRLELQQLVDRVRDDFRDEGRDEAALRAEAEGVDRDALPAMLETRAADQRRLMHELEAAGATLSAAVARRAELEAGHDANAVLTRRVEAAGEVEAIARRYLARALAARLAARAVERHRAAVENPVVARASRMFADVTGGAFRGLKPEYSDAGAVLVGRRDDGATVLVENMSEGARDQLFLALRLALLETRGAEPLPFVGDDLLASFDDARAARMLDLLAATGPDRQAILFTHHAHIAELARERANDAIEIIEL